MTKRSRSRPAQSQPKLTEAREVSMMVMVTNQMSFPVTETMAMSHSAGEVTQLRLIACLQVVVLALVMIVWGVKGRGQKKSTFF